MYTTESSFLSPPVGTRQAWADAVRPHNAAQADAITAAYFDLGAQIGLNADLALAQACHESAWFTSQHWTEQFDPCGLGVTSDTAPGATFASLEEGIKAHYEHLVSYTMAADPPIIAAWGMLDPRHDFHDGMPRVSDLVRPERQWAVPGDGYAAAIVAIANLVTGGQPMEPVTGLIDIRDQLARNADGGPNETCPLAEKRGVIVHYNGPAVHLDDLAQLQADATYHCAKDWGGGQRGDGLMYHVAIGKNGEKWLCRDLAAVLWHCGAWPENRIALAVQIPIGDDQRATPAQLRALAEVCDDWLRAGHGSREDVKGHQEVSATACPGTLMDDFVRPYRNGNLAPGPVSPLAFYAPENPYGAVAMEPPFWNRWHALDALSLALPMMGYPQAAEQTLASGRRVQRFERGWFGTQDAPDPWNVVALLPAEWPAEAAQ
ncbi:MAG: N-acetylmuramoyl-L-alanine amidase [Thermomicrobiales bacterium]